ncbi:hypothetical protein C8R47DRAFT_797821 [Mycena vitilis]|nr:hypothetical protein C8R47DRAFT_797821 [Mycena vitilis]
MSSARERSHSMFPDAQCPQLFLSASLLSAAFVGAFQIASVLLPRAAWSPPPGGSLLAARTSGVRLLRWGAVITARRLPRMRGYGNGRMPLPAVPCDAVPGPDAQGKILLKHIVEMLLCLASGGRTWPMTWRPEVLFVLGWLAGCGLNLDGPHCNLTSVSPNKYAGSTVIGRGKGRTGTPPLSTAMRTSALAVAVAGLPPASTASADGYPAETICLRIKAPRI